MPGYSTVDLDMSEDERKQALSALIQKAEALMQGRFLIFYVSRSSPFFINLSLEVRHVKGHMFCTCRQASGHTGRH